jgi:hypothetical protein
MGCGWLLVAASLTMCGKEPDAGAIPTAATTAAAAPPTQTDEPRTTEAQATALRARRDVLAAAYHHHRCVLIGSVLPANAKFDDATLADTAAFEKAWSSEAAAAPGWAAEAAMSSYREGCGPKTEAVDGQQE